MENSNRIIFLFQKYLSHENTETELNELLEHLSELDEEAFRLLLSFDTDSVHLKDTDALRPAITLLDQNIRAELIKRNNHGLKVIMKSNSYARYMIVAATIALMVIGVYFFRHTSTRTTNDHTSITKTDIAPGKNRATLTFSNGESIQLSEAKTGVVVTNVIKYNDGSAVGAVSGAESNQTISASTPRGGTYQIVLPDGTKVWLNAASKLEFPSSFQALNKRIVKLEGEAYFEVASAYTSLRGQQSKKAFIVESGRQKVEVLGTHFNISAYSDEVVSRTTLLEGSVKITGYNGQSALIRPGEQAIVMDKGLNVDLVDVTESIAWKNGDIQFDNRSITDIMKMIARWYDVEVIYEGDLPEGKWDGSISRGRSLKQVLQMMEKSKEVQFRISGHKVYVSK